VSASCLFLDRLVNLIDEGVDVAIRIGELPDSSMQAIRVGQVRRVICGAPSYFKKHGKPQTPEDLYQHSIISASSITPNPVWKLFENGIERNIRLHARMITTTNDSAVGAAVSGFGLTRLLSYQVEEHLKTKKLEVVLAQFEATTIPVHVVHREGRHAPQRVRSFLDLVIERLRQDERLNSK
jgi:DNA-binding transcriptional LysR family regulator